MTDATVKAPANPFAGLYDFVRSHLLIVNMLISTQK